MAVTVQVPDLGTSNAEVDAYFRGFSVSRQTDGEGGVVYMATLTVNVKDSVGNDFKQASYSKELGSAAKSSLRDFIVNQMLPGLRAQESL